MTQITEDLAEEYKLLQLRMYGAKPGAVIPVSKELFASLALTKPIGNQQVSDGSSADYYKLPEGATQLQDIISYRDMNAQMGEIFRATMRYGQCPHSPKSRELKKIIFYAQAELKRLEKYDGGA